MANPGRGPGGWLPPYFQTKLRPEGLKKVFWRPGPTLSQGLEQALGLVEEPVVPCGPTSFLGQTEIRRAKENYFRCRVPISSQGLE